MSDDACNDWALVEAETLVSAGGFALVSPDVGIVGDAAVAVGVDLSAVLSCEVLRQRFLAVDQYSSAGGHFEHLSAYDVFSLAYVIDEGLESVAVFRGI